MDRLIVFGCSLAYGVGLPDCWPPRMPSKLNWCQLVADAMQKQLINMSVPGSSNKRICHEINRFKFRPTDTVIISWSYPNRSSIIKSNKNIINLHHNSPNTESDIYYKYIYSKYDSDLASKLYVDYSNRILKDQNLKVYNLIVEKHYKNILTDTVSVPLHICSYERSYPKGLDNAHIGLEGNRAFAIDLLDYIGVDHSIIETTKPYNLIKRLKIFLEEINWKHIRL